MKYRLVVTDYDLFMSKSKSPLSDKLNEYLGSGAKKLTEWEWANEDHDSYCIWLDIPDNPSFMLL